MCEHELKYNEERDIVFCAKCGQNWVVEDSSPVNLSPFEEGRDYNKWGQAEVTCWEGDIRHCCNRQWI